MRKKLILILAMLCLTTGCVCVQTASIEEIVDEILTSKVSVYNHNNEGFKYYLPSGMNVESKDEFNEIIKSDGYTYYLYVDLVRFYNEKESTFKKNEDIYYNYIFENDNKKGVINVYNEGKGIYLVYVEYNYAKIETHVKKADINLAVTKALLITTSVKYNKNVISNMLGEDLVTAEEEVSVFEIKDDSSTVLQVDDTYYEDKSYDSEVIN